MTRITDDEVAATIETPGELKIFILTCGCRRKDSGVFISLCQVHKEEVFTDMEKTS